MHRRKSDKRETGSNSYLNKLTLAELLIIDQKMASVAGRGSDRRLHNK